MGKRIALVIGMVILVAGAGIGGFLYGKHVGESSFLRARQQFTRGAAGFGGQGVPVPGMPGATGGTPAVGRFAEASRNAVFGSIDAIEGDVLVIKTEQDTVRVHVSDSTLIEKTMSVAIDQMKQGDQVMVAGTRNEDGSINARSVQSIRGMQPQPGN